MAVPQAPVVTLSDSDYRYAARHSLGLHPQHDLPPKCVCGESLRDDPAHFHSCPRLMPRAITARHDALVQVVASMFKRAGGMVTIEVKCEGETRIRPDIEIILPDRSLLVDVAVVHPAAPSRKARRSWLPHAILKMLNRQSTVKWPQSVGLVFWRSSPNHMELWGIKLVKS